MKVKVKIAQLGLTLCDAMSYTVHVILQVRILEWVVIPFSRGSSRARNQTRVSCITGGFFTSWATGKPLIPHKNKTSEVAQSCPTLCDPMDCSLQRSTVHGIFQARVLEWAAISFSRGSSQPRDGTWVSHIVGRCFTIWTTREVIIPHRPG